MNFKQKFKLTNYCFSVIKLIYVVFRNKKEQFVTLILIMGFVIRVSEWDKIVLTVMGFTNGSGLSPTVH